MSKKKPTPLLDEFAKNANNPEFIKRMLDKFLSNEGGIVDIALDEIAQKDKAKQRAAEKKRAKDLEILVSADSSSAAHYRINIKNNGNKTYKNFSMDFRQILLFAESFGIDTTHMPAGQQYIAGEKIFIASLMPGEATTFLQEGYSTHEKYNCERKRVIKLDFSEENPVNTGTHASWAYALIDLPNARRRNEKFYG